MPSPHYLHSYAAQWAKNGHPARWPNLVRARAAGLLRIGAEEVMRKYATANLRLSLNRRYTGDTYPAINDAESFPRNTQRAKKRPPAQIPPQ